MKKTLFSVLLVLLASFSILIASGFFVDLDDNPYRNAIEGLFELTWLGGDYGEEFLPKEPLTRGQAAHWLSEALKLPRIEPLDIDHPVEKSYTYKDPLGVIDESFVVSTYKDMDYHYYREEVEGLSRARILSLKPLTWTTPSLKRNFSSGWTTRFSVWMKSTITRVRNGFINWASWECQRTPLQNRSLENWQPVCFIVSLETRNSKW